ncbi:hypothetical protein AM500_18245 [Bacillus sp. FJAT-18017]|nr:hypothetical protein AM500_18245 [Bacillus sp. FJAT-18017]
MVITSLPKRKEERDNQPPSQYSAATLWYHILSQKNKSTFDKKRVVPGTKRKTAADLFRSSFSNLFIL